MTVSPFFALTDTPIEPAALYAQLSGHSSCGAVAVFEGRVRDHNDGRQVLSLEYSVYEALAQKQGADIMARACEKFAVENAVCVHRYGHLAVGDIAVWTGVAAGHREAAFAACRFIIDTVKAEVPIWKKEHYRDSGASAWPENREAQHYHSGSLK